MAVRVVGLSHNWKLWAFPNSKHENDTLRSRYTSLLEAAETSLQMFRELEEQRSVTGGLLGRISYMRAIAASYVLPQIEESYHVDL